MRLICKYEVGSRTDTIEFHIPPSTSNEKATTHLARHQFDLLFVYKARGAVVRSTIKGCPPSNANKTPPTH